MKHLALLPLLLALALLPACSSDGRSGDDDNGTDSDVDTDSDTNSDKDSDNDTDTDTDSECDEEDICVFLVGCDLLTYDTVEECVVDWDGAIEGCWPPDEYTSCLCDCFDGDPGCSEYWDCLQICVDEWC